MATAASATANATAAAASSVPGPVLWSGPPAGALAGLAIATGEGNGIGVSDGRGVGLGEGTALGVTVGLGDGAGTTVGGAVGAAVGGGVGGGVGRGVGVGGGAVRGAAPTTMTVPFIDGWNVQWYAYVPAVVKVMVFPPSGGIAPVSNAPVSDVAVWSSGSLFSQLTVSPALIVTVGGTKVKLWMATDWLAAQAGMASDTLMRRTAAATRSIRVRRIR